MKQHSYNFWKSIPSFLVIGLMMSVSILRGQTIYTGPNNGDWSTAANWSNGLPTVGNEPTIVGGTIVCINGTVTINYAVTNFGSIINKGTTTLSGSINSGGALENQSLFTIATGATMTSSGGFTNSGTLTNNGNVNSNSALTNTSTGIFNNFSIWSQNGAATNDGIMSNKAGTFSCPAALTNNKTIENLAGATWKIDFGGSFTNAVGSTLTNAGQFQNLGTFTNNTTVTNSGTFTNNGIHTCNGVFNNESGGRLESTATVNVTGRINNKLGGTITSSFRFNVLANGYISNSAQFTNANMIDIALGGTFCNETLSTLTGQFGSAITNAGYFKISSSSTVTTNGSITNSRKLDIYGTYDAMGGGQIINSDSLCNYGLVKNVNVINNSGVWKNLGTTENNSGGVWTNTNKIENNKGALISNNYEIYNRPAASIVNNGTFLNNIRVFNEGTVTNNAYFVAAGDFINKVGGSLINTEVFVVREGSIQNEGAITNQKTLINETCSIVTNKAGGTINNTGRFENKGIIFQRGTVSGNAILALGGHTQGAGSNAPSLCQTTLVTGTDAAGEAKVYGQNGFKTGIGIDECAGFQYFANDVNRYVYQCSQIGQTLSTNFKIITRTGDSLTCTVPTTIFDNVSPVVSNCPKDATIYTTQNTATYSWPPVTGIDNCGDTPVVTESTASGTAFPLGTTQVTISVKDSHNNTTDCIFKLNVVKISTTATCPATDAAAPVFANCPANQTINSTGSSAVVVWNAPSVTDNCYPVVVQQNLNSGIAFPSGTNTVTYTAKDPTGNVGTCSFTVTVNGVADICTTDPIKPVIVNCPANFFGTVNAAINGAVGYWSTPTATDNCGGAVTLTGSAVSGSIFNVGTTTVTYTATDAKNNTSTCSFTVNVAAANPCAGDVTGPVLTCPANVVVNATGSSATATWATPTPTDACAPVVLNGSHQSGNTFAVGTTTVTYTASDKVGNTSKCTFTVNVSNPCLNDTQAPTLSACPAAQTLTSSNGATATATWTAPTATDNCTLAGVTSNYTSGSAFNIGTTNVVYTASDVSGNTATCSFPITVNISNVAACAGNIVLNQSFESNFANWVNGGNSSTIVNDANSGAQAVSICGDNQMLKSQTYAAIGGTYTLTVRAKTNVTTATAFVGLDFLDATGAVISTARVQRNVTSTAYATYTMTGVKPANATSIVVFAYKTGAAACLLVDDFCLTNPCTNDVTAPTFTGCPANQTIAITGTATTAVATWTAPVASDNCSTPSVVNNFPSGSAFPVGTTTVTYVATDNAGLKSTCSFTITVTNPCASDVTPPSFGTTCPASKSVASTNGACVTTTWVAPTATDNCSTPSVSSTHTTDFCFPVGTSTVVYTAADALGNKATCSFTVTVSGQNSTCSGGLTGSYYNNNSLSGTPILIRTEAIDFAWGPNSPDPSLPTDNFSARWEGQILAPVSGTYTFKTTTDDGVRLWVNNQLIIDKWIPQSPTSWTGTITLVAGQKYPIKMEYNEYGGDATAQLFWSYTGQAEQIVPTSKLCPNIISCATSAVTGGITRDYWANITSASTSPVTLPTSAPTSTSVLTSFESPQNVADNYIQRVRGFLRPSVSGNYTFYLTGDDNSDLYISTSTDEALKTQIAYINGWTGNAELTKYPSQKSATIALVAGQNYYIEATEQEGGGGDNLAVYWVIPNSTTPVVIPGSNLVPYCSSTVNPCATDTTAPTFTFCPPSQAITATGTCTTASWSAPIATDNCGTPTVTFVTSPTAGLASGSCFPEGATNVSYTATDAKGNKGYCSLTININPAPTPTFTISNCGGNGEQLILKGAIDYLSIGNTMSQSEDRNNCNKNASSAKTLTLPAGAIVKAAYLYWSGSGSLDNTVTLNGSTVTAQGTKTYYEPAWGMYFFGARANVTSKVTASGLYTVSGLTWNNTGNYCTSNSAYGAWSMVVVYEKAGLTYSTIHINTDNFRMTYPANNYSSNINCINIPAGCNDNAKLTIIAFEGDNYKGETLTIGGVNRGDNNFRGQSGPNLDILTFDVSSVVNPGTTSLNYTINSYLSYTIWGNAIEGLFDYVKVLKYNSCSATTNSAAVATILDVNAKAETNRARIEWVNNTGYKNDYFSVEKLNNTTGDFDKVSVQNSISTDVAEHYVAYDNNPTEGDNFYRVGVTFNDGSVKYSETKKVVFNNLGSVRIYPNPANDNFSIDLKTYQDKAVGIRLYNATGKLLSFKQVEKASNEPIQFETSNLPVGSYFVRISSEGKRELTKQVIIVR